MEFARRERSLIFTYIGLGSLFIVVDLVSAATGGTLAPRYAWYLLWLVAVGGVLLTELYRWKRELYYRDARMHGSFLLGIVALLRIWFVDNLPGRVFPLPARPLDVALGFSWLLIAFCLLLWTGFEVYRYIRRNWVFTGQTVRRFYAGVLGAVVVCIIVAVVLLLVRGNAGS